MNIVIIVLVLLWSALKAVVGFLWRYKIQILELVLALIAVYIVYTIFYAIWEYFSTKRKRKNEIKLLQYLEENCKNCGYMNQRKWQLLLPQFAKKNYLSGFDQITNTFARDMEKEYFERNKAEWMLPVIKYLMKNGMADICELTKLPNTFLKHTHATKDAVMVNRELEVLCEILEKDGKRILDKIKLERESVKKMYPYLGNNVEEVYLNAYKINEHFMTEQILQNGNIITHEISADDLGII